MNQPAKVVTLLPVAPFVLELHSERMVDALLALTDAGFKVTYVKGSLHRYRIDDTTENTK